MFLHPIVVVCNMIINEINRAILESILIETFSDSPEPQHLLFIAMFLINVGVNVRYTGI